MGIGCKSSDPSSAAEQAGADRAVAARPAQTSELADAATAAEHVSRPGTVNRQERQERRSETGEAKEATRPGVWLQVLYVVLFCDCDGGDTKSRVDAAQVNNAITGLCTQLYRIACQFQAAPSRAPLPFDTANT